MQLAEKKQALLEKGKHFRKTVEYNQFLRRLIAAYSSPFLEPLYDYSELIASRKEKAATALDERFENDRDSIVQKLVNNLNGQKKSESFKNCCSKDIQNLSATEQVIVKTVLHLFGASKSSAEALPAELMSTLERVANDSKTATEPKEVSRKLLAEIILDQVVEEPIIPRLFEYDHLEDIIDIVRSRYAGKIDKHWDRSDLILDALRLVTASDTTLTDRDLVSKLQSIFGTEHKYKPKYGTAHPDIKKVIPDLFDELINIKAKDNLGRFLEINKEYSFRQRQYHKEKSKGNPWGLPLIAGLEEDHHLMLRTLIKLKQKNLLTREDEVLVVGPRYVDELAFFRKHLGFPRTTGLDLFEDPEEGIVAGDMHNTKFAEEQFGLIFCAGTLAYAYDLRKVAREFTRILKRPGFLCLMDAGDRVNGVDPLGRSDPMGLEALLGCFYEHKMIVHAEDKGRTPLPSMFKWWPCAVIEITE